MSSPARALVLLAVCVFSAICTEVLPVGLLPEISAGLRVSQGSAGILVSLYAILVAVMSLPIAAAAVTWRRRTVVAGLLGVYCLSNLVFAAAPDYAVAVAARVIGGLAHAGFFAVAVATAVSLVEPARSGRAIAILMVGNALALVAGVPLGTVLGTAVGWRWTFAALAAVTAALSVAAFLVLPVEHPSVAAERTPVADGLRRPAVLLVSAAITLLALGPFGLAAAGAVVVRWPEQALLLDSLLLAAGLLLAAVVSSPTRIVADVVVWGVAFGALPTLTQTVAVRAARDAPDTASALVNATMNVGIAGGAILGATLLHVLAVPRLGWVAAALVGSSIAVYGVTLLRARAAAGRRAVG